MLTADELAQARDDLEAELTDTVTIRRQSGSAVDPDTLEETPAWEVPYPAVDALVTPVSSRSNRAVELGDTEVGITEYQVTVPVDVVSILPGDQVLVDASTDPAVEGATLTVIRASLGTLSISRRLSCQVTDR